MTRWTWRTPATVALTWTMMTVSLAPPSLSSGKLDRVEAVTSNRPVPRQRDSELPDSLVLEWSELVWVDLLL